MTNAAPTIESTLSQWLIYMGNIHVSAIDMGLERVLPVAKKLGLFDLVDKPYVFTVAGTNGKGSTTATIAQICQQAGYKTALYQSPHLVSFNERIRIDGVEVADKQLIAAFIAVEEARLACELSLSFFEMTTLAAFWLFNQAVCDVWVLEVGLGGRLDVVNIIDPDVCVITNVSIDHIDWLGDNREKIGFEKAGILRQNSTLIYGELSMPNSVEKAILDKQAVCYQRGVYYQVVDDGCFDGWVYTSTAITINLPKPKLSLENASTAVSAVLASSLNIKMVDIADGLKQVQLVGRFDKRWLNERTWLFDVAHNLAGVHFLFEQFIPMWIDYQHQYPDARLHLIFSMLADKDVDAVLSLVASFGLDFASIHTAVINHSRALALPELKQKLHDTLSPSLILTHHSLALAVQELVVTSAKMDFVLVFGSFYTISECLIGLGQYRDFKPIV